MKSITEVVQNLLKPYIDAGGDIIVITASYGNIPSASDNFIAYLEPLLSNTYRNIYTAVQGGARFVDGSYLTMLQNISVADADAVKHILVCGYGNDIAETDSDFINAVGAFVTYAKSQYPHADVKIAPISIRSTEAHSKALNDKTKVLISSIDSHGANIMTSINHILALNYNTYVAADGYHPTTAGAKLIARAIYNTLLNGDANFYTYQGQNVTNKTSRADVTLTSGEDYAFFRNNESAKMTLTANFQVTSPVTITPAYSNFRIMSANPAYRGFNANPDKEIPGFLTDTTDGRFCPIRIVIQRDVNDDTWYDLSSMSGANFNLTVGHDYKLRVTGFMPFDLV